MLCLGHDCRKALLPRCALWLVDRVRNLQRAEIMCGSMLAACSRTSLQRQLSRHRYPQFHLSNTLNDHELACRCKIW